MNNTFSITLVNINARTDRSTARLIKQRWLNINPDFQREYEAWDKRMKTRFIESIILGRAMNPIWTVNNPNEPDEHGSEEILDGMHRITTAISFLRNEFSLDGKYFTSLNEEEYGGKSFDEFDSDSKQKIENYNFMFNQLDSSYRRDMNKLKDMYEILNRSSKPLNEIEFMKPILKPIYDIIEKYSNVLNGTTLLSSVKISRGGLIKELLEYLVLSNELPRSWSSVTNLLKRFVKNDVGDVESVRDYIVENQTIIENKLKFIKKIDRFYCQNYIYPESKKEKNSIYMVLKLVTSRILAHIRSISFLNRHEIALTEFIKDIRNNLLLKTAGNRNAKWQQDTVMKIDGFIRELISNDSPRLFTPKQKHEILLRQNGICPECNKKIKKNDETDVDHIKPYTCGGQTVLDNGQVLHRRCHQRKNHNNNEWNILNQII